MSNSRSRERASFTPSGIRKRSLRAVRRIVPPRRMMPPTEDFVRGIPSPSRSPSYPLRMPITSTPRKIAVRVTARTAAFIPGESPPLDSTAILFIPFPPRLRTCFGA